MPGCNKNPGFIVNLEPLKFKAGDMMSELIRNTARPVPGKTITNSELSNFGGLNYEK